MLEKRAARRSKRRFLVEFETTLSKVTGFTHDVSRTGLFVRTNRIPRLGKILRAVLHLPGGKQVNVNGTVVRIFRASSTLSSVVPSGFGLRLSSDNSAEYQEFASSLEKADIS